MVGGRRISKKRVLSFINLRAVIIMELSPVDVRLLAGTVSIAVAVLVLHAIRRAILMTPVFVDIARDGCNGYLLAIENVETGPTS